jgi:hypothetical protein
MSEAEAKVEVEVKAKAQTETRYVPGPDYSSPPDYVQSP